MRYLTQFAMIIIVCASFANQAFAGLREVQHRPVLVESASQDSITVSDVDSVYNIHANLLGMEVKPGDELTLDVVIGGPTTTPVGTILRAWKFNQPMWEKADTVAAAVLIMIDPQPSDGEIRIALQPLDENYIPSRIWIDVDELTNITVRDTVTVLGHHAQWERMLDNHITFECRPDPSRHQYAIAGHRPFQQEQQ